MLQKFNPSDTFKNEIMSDTISSLININSLKTKIMPMVKAFAPSFKEKAISYLLAQGKIAVALPSEDGKDVDIVLVDYKKFKGSVQLNYSEKDHASILDTAGETDMEVLENVELLSFSDLVDKLIVQFLQGTDEISTQEDSRLMDFAKEIYDLTKDEREFYDKTKGMEQYEFCIAFERKFDFDLPENIQEIFKGKSIHESLYVREIGKMIFGIKNM
jgi:hypothetical protein